MKVFSLLGLFLAVLFLFQNCGNSQQGNGLFQDQSLIESTSCEDSGQCVTGADYLWLKIREYEPYRIEISTVVTHFNVAGECGVGDFPKHSFLWELREGFGNQEVVGQGFEDNRCEFGQFSVPIIPNLMALVPNQRYNLTLELVGVNENDSEVTNPMPTNMGTLDILFTTEPPN